MRITCLGNSLKVVFVLFASSFCIPVLASDQYPWLWNTEQGIKVTMADGNTYGVNVAAGVSGVFLDPAPHRVEGRQYVALYQVAPSSTGEPTGFCGAGKEVWLSVYEVTGTALSARSRVLVGSCLRNVALASQNTGEADQTSDFSSVQWNNQGFSIDWLTPRDATGRLNPTHYVLHDKVFAPQGT